MGKRKPTSIDEWRAVYYSAASKQTRAALRVRPKYLLAEIAGKDGLPNDLPSPTTGDGFWSNMAACNTAARQAFEEGYWEALLRYCIWHWRYARLNRSDISKTDELRAVAQVVREQGLLTPAAVADQITRLANDLDRSREELDDEDELPHWAQDALRAAFELRLAGESTSIDAALQRVRAGRPTERQRSGDEIVAAIEDACRSGVALTDGLFDAVGEEQEPKVSGSTVKRIWHTVPHKSSTN